MTFKPEFYNLLNSSLRSFSFLVWAFLWLLIVLRFFLSFYIFYFQDLSENHPAERVSWL